MGSYGAWSLKPQLGLSNVILAWWCLDNISIWWIGPLIQTKYSPAKPFQPPLSAQDVGRTPESTHVFKGPTRAEGQGIIGGETSGDQDCEQEQQQSPSDGGLVVGL